MAGPQTHPQWTLWIESLDRGTGGQIRFKRLAPCDRVTAAAPWWRVDLLGRRPRLFRYLAREEGHPTASSDCRFVEVAEGTRVEISAQQDPRPGPVGLYDRLVVPWALKRMLDRQMVSVSITQTERRRRASGTA